MNAGADGLSEGVAVGAGAGVEGIKPNVDPPKGLGGAVDPPNGLDGAPPNGFEAGAGGAPKLKPPEGAGCRN